MSPSQRSWRRTRAIETAVAGLAHDRLLARSTDREGVTGSTSGHVACADGSSHQPQADPTDVPEGMLPSEASPRLADPVSPGLLAQDSEPPAPAAAPSIAVLGYASVNLARPGVSTPDLRRQAREITAACERHGLLLIRVAHDHVSPRQVPLERPGLRYALGRITAGEARGLMVSELSRLAGALPELGRVLEWLTFRDVRFIATVPWIDTSEEAGRLAVQTIIEVSRWERQRLVDGTRAGMRAARRKGPASITDYPELRERIAGMRAGGMTLQAIADQLNSDGIPTIRGGAKWRPSSVQAAAGYQRPPTGRSLARRPRGAAPVKADGSEVSRPRTP